VIISSVIRYMVIEGKLCGRKVYREINYMFYGQLVSSLNLMPSAVTRLTVCLSAI